MFEEESCKQSQDVALDDFGVNLISSLKPKTSCLFACAPPSSRQRHNGPGFSIGNCKEVWQFLQEENKKNKMQLSDRSLINNTVAFLG